MPKRGKRFIDKKNAVTFQLVHRSQKDPLVTDENAPKRVLKPILENKERNDDLEKYGIYFDDDYDYMQHLKPCNSTSTTLLPVEQTVKQKKEDTRITLPSSVFQSHVEEKVGILNKAAPSRGLDLSLDPDIVAAMDSDYDFSDPENDFDDDFILQLNAPRKPTEGSDDADSDVDSMDGFDEEYDDEEEYEEEDDLGSLEDFETKSRFTDYSMTSSVMRRNEQLRHLDDRFEEMFAAYDETEIGALDTEEIEGDMDIKNQLLLEMAQQFENTIKPEKLETQPTEFVDSESESEGSDCSLVEVKQEDKWDCQSILSTYSNIYNHPKIIDAPPSKIKINPKTGIPETKTRLTAKALAALSGGDEFTAKSGPRSLASAISLLSMRPKDEKPEERLERKKAFRQHKLERRKEKKLNTLAFKEEKRRMEKMMAHNKSNHIVKI